MKKLAIFSAIIIGLFLIVPPLLPSSVGHALHALHAGVGEGAGC